LLKAAIIVNALSSLVAAVMMDDSTLYRLVYSCMYHLKKYQYFLYPYISRFVLLVDIIASESLMNDLNVVISHAVHKTTSTSYTTYCKMSSRPLTSILNNTKYQTVPPKESMSKPSSLHNTPKRFLLFYMRGGDCAPCYRVQPLEYVNYQQYSQYSQQEHP
jgi:hypothetical protein